MTAPTRTYPRTARAQVLNFVQSLEISDTEQAYAAEIFKKSSFSAKDLKILLEIVASKAKISPFQLATLGLPTFVHEVHQEMAQ
jgi:hypothetical protein